MTLLILGLLLWAGVHFFKRVAPDARAKMGEKGKGPIALLLIVSVVLMVLGYRMANGPVYWDRTGAMTGINNLLMILAVYLFAASGAKTAITRYVRHPMLTGFKVWAIAHLLVNGNLESIVLFGGLLAWAVAEVIVINRAEGAWVKPDPVPAKKEVTAVIATLVVFAFIAAAHIALGYNPFG